MRYFFIVLSAVALAKADLSLAKTLQICPPESTQENPYDLTELIEQTEEQTTTEATEKTLKLRKYLKRLKNQQERYSKETDQDKITKTKSDAPNHLNDLFRPLTKFSSAIKSTANSIKQRILDLF